MTVPSLADADTGERKEQSWSAMMAWRTIKISLQQEVQG